MSSSETEPAEHLARRFHEAYERLAPSFGYQTREASAKPWSEVPENNRALMVAVCAELLATGPAVPPIPHWLIDAAQQYTNGPQGYGALLGFAGSAWTAAWQAAAREQKPGYAPALIHGRKSTLWVHGCGHVESWTTDPKYPLIEGEGCDACEGAPDGTWRQLYVEVSGE
jgi:hypothetical protein